MNPSPLRASACAAFLPARLGWEKSGQMAVLRGLEPARLATDFSLACSHIVVFPPARSLIDRSFHRSGWLPALAHGCVRAWVRAYLGTYRLGILRLCAEAHNHLECGRVANARKQNRELFAIELCASAV